MKRQYHTFLVNNISHIQQQMRNWVSRFGVCCFLDNCWYTSSYHSFECIAGAGAIKIFTCSDDFFPSLEQFTKANEDWLFGHFNYDLKNITEPGLTSKNPDKTAFPDYFLFVPEVVLQLQGNRLTIGVIQKDVNEVLAEILAEPVLQADILPLTFKPAISRADYLTAVLQLQKHIRQGDCYEINYCQEFYATEAINPLAVYQKLLKTSPNPFSAYYKLNDKYLLCASPERYMKKVRDTLLSQPMKGTAARDHTDLTADTISKKKLSESAKDRSENVMVVDLVRNDLSKICARDSVVVGDLYGVYSFPNVHQMVSTVTGTLQQGRGFADVLQATFPMGSMTGAPKKRVMELIEKYERSKRGVYSGTVGYISPENDFDFNVVIRSLVYNESDAYLSFHTGSAITSYSNAEEEYEECLLKGQAIASVFSGSKTIGSRLL